MNQEQADANQYVQEIIDRVSDGQQQFQQDMEEEEEYGEEEEGDE